jgi:polysaccharide export outer membrane protein
MIFKTVKPFFLLIFTLVILGSCTSPKKMIYFNTAEQIAAADANKNYTPVFHTDDFLAITVMGLDMEAIQPFNLPISNLQSSNSGYTMGASSPQGYLIDQEGNIDFPVIGKLKLAGLNRMEATTFLKEKLGVYVSNPTIHIRILNFKVTVLGEVKSPGTFNIPNERITLLEAIGLAGDLNITAKRKNVLVIRDIDGKKTETRIDLTSKALFSSPVYYLNQNDMVYIEPNRAKINSSVVNASNVGIVISVISLLVTMSVLFTR